MIDGIKLAGTAREYQTIISSIPGSPQLSAQCMVLQVTLQDAQRETAVLARRLGLAARENEELAMSASETQPSLAGKVDRGLLRDCEIFLKVRF